MSNEPNTYGRVSYIDVLKQGLEYIEKRRRGDIKSLRTPWPGLNSAGIAGLEWGSMLTIGARPGAGKTMFVSQLIRESHRLNPDQKFNILEFQFEMNPKQYAARQFAGELALDYGIVLSASYPVEQFMVDRMNQYIKENEYLFSKGIRREMHNIPLTASQMEEAIKEFYIIGGRKPLIVTIDHSWLIKKQSSDKDKFDVLYNTTEMLMRLKNEIPVTILMITQLNRSIEEASRRVASSIANYPTSSDIFGGDALMQGSDMVVVLSRPTKLDIRSYGPYAYEVNDDSVFMHLLKVRNGDESKSMLFLKMEGKRQRMVEVPEFKAERPDGSYVPFTQRAGRTGRNTSAPIGSEL